MPVAAHVGLEELRQAKQNCTGLGLWVGSMMQGEKEEGWSARLYIAPSAPQRLINLTATE
jgi:hypothetical protein